MTSRSRRLRELRRWFEVRPRRQPACGIEPRRRVRASFYFTSTIGYNAMWNSCSRRQPMSRATRAWVHERCDDGRSRRYSIDVANCMQGGSGSDVSRPSPTSQACTEMTPNATVLHDGHRRRGRRELREHDVRRHLPAVHLRLGHRADRHGRRHLRDLPHDQLLRWRSTASMCSALTRRSRLR